MTELHRPDLVCRQRDRSGHFVRAPYLNFTRSRWDKSWVALSIPVAELGPEEGSSAGELQ